MNDLHDLSRDEALEKLLRAALNRSGASAPFRVDVTDAVMARVAEFGPAPRTEMGWHQFTRWALAASLIGVALIAAASLGGPSLGEIAHGLGRATADTVGAAAKLSQPVGTFASAVGRSALVLVDAARTLAQPLGALRPLAQLLLGIAAVAMAGFTAVVVGRDLRTLTEQKEQA